MLKFLLILILVFYLVYKLAGFLVRVMVMNVAQQQQKQAQPNSSARKAKRGNVNIDYVPSEAKPGGTVKGGEYVDFEEIK